MEIMSWFCFEFCALGESAHVCFTVIILFACCKACSLYYCIFFFLYSALVVEYVLCKSLFFF